MSKFCTKCGRPLQEGEICSCQTAAGNTGGSQQMASAQPVSPSGQAVQRPVQPVSQPARQQAAQPVSPSGQPAQQQAAQPVSPSGQPARQQAAQPVGPSGQPQPVKPASQSGQPSGGQPYNENLGGQPYNGSPAGQPSGGQPYNGSPAGQQMGQQFDARQFGNQASSFAQNFMGRVLNLVMRPVTAGKELIMEADIRAAMLLIVFQGIFSGLFSLAVAGKLSQYVKAASGLADGISSGLGSVMAGALTMPYFRIFIVTVVFSVVLAVALAGMLMLGHLIMKIPASFQQMLSVVAIRSAVLVPAILLSIIIFELSFGVGLALFILINIWGFAAMIVAMSPFIAQEKLNVFVLAVSIIILLFVFIAFFAFSRIWTLYLPDLLRTGLSQLGNASGQEILREIMGELF